MTIFKVFIRPSYEYCIPILYTWIQKVDLKLMKKLDEIHMNGLNFIFNTKKYGGTTRMDNISRHVLESLSGLGSFTQRLTILKASLANHLRRLDESNPLKQFHSQQFLLFHKGSILNECMESDHLRGFLKQRSDLFPLTWRGYNRKTLGDSFYQNSGKLTKYILIKCRRPNLMDHLLLQPQTLAKKGILWRTNRAFINRLCPVCGNQFNRRHINDCGLYGLLAVASDIMDSKDFKREYSKLNQEYLDKNHYSILDHLLNHQEYGEFENLYDTLDEFLLKSNLPSSY